MILNIKHFLMMSLFFAYVCGVTTVYLLELTVFDIKAIMVMAALVIGLLGCYVSFKGFNLLFSRDYKRVK